jgi:hypothetical protein
MKLKLLSNVMLEGTLRTTGEIIEGDESLITDGIAEAVKEEETTATPDNAQPDSTPENPPTDTPLPPETGENNPEVPTSGEKKEEGQPNGDAEVPATEVPQTVEQVVEAPPDTHVDQPIEADVKKKDDEAVSSPTPADPQNPAPTVLNNEVDTTSSENLGQPQISTASADHTSNDRGDVEKLEAIQKQLEEKSQ